MTARAAPRPSARGRRVVVTGLGVISPIGVGLAAFAAGLRTGRSGAAPVRGFDTTGFEHDIACEVPDFDAADWLQELDPADLGRASRFAVAAARLAVADASGDPAAAEHTVARLRSRHGLIAIGTTMGESRDIDALVAQELAHGPAGMSPALARRINAGRLSVSIAHELGLTDVEPVTVPTACAAGNYAIGHGYDAVRAGDVDFALCGGADALCRKTFAGFYRLGAMAPDRCRPFDLDRRGMLTGEGAGVLLLEDLESARARGARIHAEVLGYGLNCDAAHPVAPDSDSVARCMRLALDDANVEPEEVDLISAHGTATKANDIAEARAIRGVFGDASPPRTVSMKSMLGHTLGAASALAAIGCVVAIGEGFIPPTINHEETDPECGLDCVPNEAVEADLRVVQNNALAFGGNNAVLLLGRYEEPS
ncbi:beta-ketoacyl-[acyl-carrier-protein] synthase family protein [Actinomadura spongiicola]|uniref:Beta-ketoacyl-[acyl-carrier-protein] synthase family protein n=1 Tax=Actinomadura spongiicola TaxID=2303421 RepID=A0A372GGL0_9ACTN|nr:beta-ketoacyl-[acyl-carrier-protein] synthase family protein [Actinomadura spongiicola]RFS84322.1 beta-ketoacyl-[acyl-carrier-protein] synthase family protein [Actinomadura spongiicola]